MGRPGGDQSLSRHSALKDISTPMLSNLQMAWSQSSGALRGHEGQPLVDQRVGGKPMMFIIGAAGCPSATSSRRSTCPTRIIRCRSGTTEDQRTAMNPRYRAPVATRSIAAVRMRTASSCSARSTATSIALDAADRQGSVGRQARASGQGRDDHASPDHRERQGPRSASAATNSPRAAASPPMRWPTARRSGNANHRHRQRRLPDRQHQQEASRVRHGRQGLGIQAYPGDEWQRGGGAAWGWYAMIPTCTSSTTQPATRACGARRSVAAPSRRRRKPATTASATTSGR